MTDVAAAIGTVQLERLDALQRRRRAIVDAYTEAFRDLDAFVLPAERADVAHAWQLYVLRLRPQVLRISRDRLIDELAARNIGTSVRSEEHTSELQSRQYLVCRLLLEK